MIVTAMLDGSDELIFQIELADNDPINCDHYAQQVADQFQTKLEQSDENIPLGCGDFTIEIAEKPLSAVCWSTKSYFLTRD